MTRHENDLIVEALLLLAKRALAEDNNQDSGIGRLDMMELVGRLEKLNEYRRGQPAEDTGSPVATKGASKS